MKTIPQFRWLFALALLAFMDDIYITISHFLPGPPPPYAYWMGIPSAPLGLVMYAFIMALIYFYMKSGKMWQFYTLLAVLTSQFMSGVSVFYTQAFVLGFFCAYAYLYVVITACMFFLIVTIWASMGHEKGNPALLS